MNEYKYYLRKWSIGWFMIYTFAFDISEWNVGVDDSPVATDVLCGIS